MSWLRRGAASVGRGSLRGAGNLLSKHVLPDTLLPSWKTKQRLASAIRGVNSFGKSKSKKSSTSGKKSSTPSKKSRKSTAKKAPQQRGGLPVFNRNAWARGAQLQSSGGFSGSSGGYSAPRPRPTSARAKLQRLKAQALDVLLNPRAVGQMVYDSVSHDAKKTKKRFLSKVSTLRNRYK